MEILSKLVQCQVQIRMHRTIELYKSKEKAHDKYHGLWSFNN